MNDYDNKNEYEGDGSYHYRCQSPGPGPNSPGPRMQTSGGSDLLSWLVDVVLLFVLPPVGAVFTILHAMGNDLLKGLNSKRPSASRSKAAYRQHSAAQRTAPEAASGTEAKEKAPGGPTPVDAGATVLTVFGWILAIFGVAFIISFLHKPWWLVAGICLALGGGAMLLSAATNKRKAKAFARCMTVIGSEGIVDMRSAAATLGIKLTELDREMTEMIDRGYFGPKAYIDHQRALLVIRPEEMRDVYRREDEAKAKAARQEKEAGQSEHERIIEQIRQADEDIADEVMSGKIRRMQTITASIFREVEAHPEKKGQITRFMNYYLPTTLKLLDAYARIEAQGVSGENTAKAKADIERIADTLVEGYEKQLDTLYRAEAMDIAGDVQVIENMMKRDGLTGEASSPFRTAAGGGTT